MHTGRCAAQASLDSYKPDKGTLPAGAKEFRLRGECVMKICSLLIVLPHVTICWVHLPQQFFSGDCSDALITCAGCHLN